MASRSENISEPFVTGDGRGFEVLDWWLYRGSGEVAWLCVVEVQEYAGGTFIEYRVTMRKSCFERYIFDPENVPAILTYVRQRVFAHLNSNRQQRAWSRCCLPVYLECQ